ncbi:MAG: hypothetical protein JWN78_1222 [Bacteroidota bacterium]|nr:hypothetical protein [Bacteroidota bacterium]
MKMSIKYSEIIKQVIGLITIPLLYSGVFIAVILSMHSFHLSETMEDVIVFGGSFLLIGVSVLTVLKFIMVNGEIEYNPNGIHIHLDNRSFLFPHGDFFISYSNVENAAMNEDSAGRSFATLKIRSPKKSILILPVKSTDTDSFVSYWENLQQQFNSYNAVNTGHPELIIKSKGFYESGFMKFLAFLSLLFAGFFTGLKFMDPSSVSTWKLIVFYCYAIPFLYTVIRSNKNNSPLNMSTHEK